MYILNSEKLQDGDIILKRSNSRESKVIRQRSKSEYSHAILYVGAESCIESDGLGVHAQNLNRILFENEDDACVLRVKGSFNKSKLSNAIDFARLKIGTEYSTQEAKKSTSSSQNPALEPNRQYCTRFIAQAYNTAKLNLVDNLDYCTPQQILESKKLIKVDNVLRTANEEEVDFASENENIISRQIGVTNQMLESIRNVVKEDIQTIEQLFQYLYVNPDKDQIIEKEIRKSEYLNMWEWDFEKNPWCYNRTEFIRHFSNPFELLIYATKFAEDEPKTRDRYIRTLQTLNRMNKEIELSTVKLFITLYNKLIELSETREQIGKSLIE